MENVLRETFQSDESMIRDALKEFNAFPKFLDKSVRIPVVISKQFQNNSEQTYFCSEIFPSNLIVVLWSNDLLIS